MHVCISRLAERISNAVSLEARNNQVIELSEILATIVWSTGLPSYRPPPLLRRFVSVSVPIYLSPADGPVRPSCNLDVGGLNGNFMRHAVPRGARSTFAPSPMAPSVAQLLFFASYSRGFSRKSERRYTCVFVLALRRRRSRR